MSPRASGYRSSIAPRTSSAAAGARSSKIRIAIRSIRTNKAIGESQKHSPTSCSGSTHPARLPLLDEGAEPLRDLFRSERIGEHLEIDRRQSAGDVALGA